MLGTTMRGLGHAASPPLQPDDQPIDFAHLFRMTLGDHSLEQEVLALFDRQIEMLVGRMTGIKPAAVAALAHTIKASALGIGAWSIASAAEAVEAVSHSAGDIDFAVGELSRAAAKVRATIANRLAPA